MKEVLAVMVLIGALTCGSIAYLNNEKQGAPTMVQKTNNQDFQVAFLFESNGCKVFRFYDQHFFRYFTDCKGSTFSNETRMEGKINKTIPNDVNGGQ